MGSATPLETLTWLKSMCDIYADVGEDCKLGSSRWVPNSGTLKEQHAFLTVKPSLYPLFLRLLFNNIVIFLHEVLSIAIIDVEMSSMIGNYQII